MALQVWLPLNKNGADKNQGLANISVDNSAVYSDSGKLGGCYFYKDGLCQSFNNNLTSIIGEKRSICVWVKPAGNHIHYTGAIVSSGNWNSSNWTFGVNSNNTGVTGFGSGYSTYLSCNVPVNEWTHLTCVTNGTHHDIYKNGSYIGSLTSGNSLLYSDASNTTIGRETYAEGYFGFNGYINDVRIYDHCLSPKEVKEISRGMVLHYKMCQPERAINLIIGGNKLSAGGSGDGSITASNGVLHITSSGSYNSFYCDNNEASGTNLVNNLSVGDKFTVSFDFKSITSNSNPGLFINEGNSYIGMSGFDSSNKNKWQRVYCIRTWAAPGTRYGNLAFHINNIVGEAYIRNIKIEKGENHNPQWSPAPQDNPNWGTIEYDGSGFKNHGTVSGNVTLSADSPRYTGSYKFDNGQIVSSYNTAGLYELTYSAWINMSARHSERSCICVGGSYFTVDNAGKLSVYAYGKNPSGYLTGSITIPLNTWTHVAAVWTSSKLITYVNGVKDLDLNCTGTFTKPSYQSIGREGTSNRIFTGQISDFRIYSTALDATDVAELYKLGR